MATTLAVRVSISLLGMTMVSFAVTSVTAADVSSLTRPSSVRPRLVTICVAVYSFGMTALGSRMFSSR